MFIRFSSGTITDDARCSGGVGSFPLEQQNGLVVVVIVTDDTTIVHASSGKPARCVDLTEGTRANVQGMDDNGEIQADQVNMFILTVSSFGAHRGSLAGSERRCQGMASSNAVIARPGGRFNNAADATSFRTGGFQASEPSL